MHVSTTLLASYATYKTLYASGEFRSQYELLAEFIKYSIANKKLRIFSVEDIFDVLQSEFGFSLPRAVIRTALRKIDYIQVIPEQNVDRYSQKYSVVNQDKLLLDDKFVSIRSKALDENESLFELLEYYAKEQLGDGFDDIKNLSIRFMQYLVDDSIGDEYQEVISSFIIKASENPEIKEQLDSIRTGAILYIGLNSDIREVGQLDKELILYLDTEIIFDLVGYNGELYQILATELFEQVRIANSKTRVIKLRYFSETKQEIEGFFRSAESIVGGMTRMRDTVAMSTIVNGCEDVTDVVEKEQDFYNMLTNKYHILLAEKTDFYTTEDFSNNLEGMLPSDKYDGEEIEEAMRYISHIHKLRQGHFFCEILGSQVLFVTDTQKVLEVSHAVLEKLKEEVGDSTINSDFAIDMNRLTNLLWTKLNRGFGAKNYPANADAVIKAKIVLSNIITKSVSKTFDTYKRKYEKGELRQEELAGYLYALKQKANKPEQISSDNLDENLNFNDDYLRRFSQKQEETEEELKKLRSEIELSNEEHKKTVKEMEKAKEDISKELQNEKAINTEKHNELLSEVKSKDKLLDEKDQIIQSQQNELEKFKEKEKSERKEKERKRKICSLIVSIIGRALFIIIVGIIVYFWRRNVEEKVLSDAASYITIIGVVIPGGIFLCNKIKEFIEVVRSDKKKK